MRRREAPLPLENCLAMGLYCWSFEYIFSIVCDIELVCKLIVERWCKHFRNINRRYYIVL